MSLISTHVLLPPPSSPSSDSRPGCGRPSLLSVPARSFPPSLPLPRELKASDAELLLDPYDARLLLLDGGAVRPSSSSSSSSSSAPPAIPQPRVESALQHIPTLASHQASVFIMEELSSSWLGGGSLTPRGVEHIKERLAKLLVAELASAVESMGKVEVEVEVKRGQGLEASGGDNIAKAGGEVEMIIHETLGQGAEAVLADDGAPKKKGPAFF